MPKITFITSGGKSAEVEPSTNLLAASLRWQGGIPFKCGGGKCGTCRCRIEAGREHTDAVKPKEFDHLSDEDLSQGYRMACQTFVLGDIAVSWDPNRKPPFTRPVRPGRPATSAPPAAPSAPTADPPA